DVAHRQAERRRCPLQGLDDVGVVVVDVDQRGDLGIGEQQDFEGADGCAHGRQRDVEALAGFGGVPECRQAVGATPEPAVRRLDREHDVAGLGRDCVASVRAAGHDVAAVGDLDARDSVLAGLAQAVRVGVLEHRAPHRAGIRASHRRRSQQQAQPRRQDAHQVAACPAARMLPSATIATASRTSPSSARSCSRKAMRSRMAAWAAATALPGRPSPPTWRRRRSSAWAAVISSSPSTLPRSPAIASTWRASLAPIDTWSSALAEVGIEYTDAGIARLARSLTIAAAVYCTIMYPDSV